MNPHNLEFRSKKETETSVVLPARQFDGINLSPRHRHSTISKPTNEPQRETSLHLASSSTEDTDIDKPSRSHHKIDNSQTSRYLRQGASAMAFQDGGSREDGSSKVAGAVTGPANQVHGQTGRSQNGSPTSPSRSRDRERERSVPLSQISSESSDDDDDQAVHLAVDWAPEISVHAVERATRRADCTLD